MFQLGFDQAASATQVIGSIVAPGHPGASQAALQKALLPG